jgi:hypothetical protein
MPPRALHAGPTPRFLKNAAGSVSAYRTRTRRPTGGRTVAKQREARAEARAEEVVPRKDARDVARVAVAEVAVARVSARARDDERDMIRTSGRPERGRIRPC